MFGATGLWGLFEGIDGEDTDLSRAMPVVASVLWGLVSTYVVARGRERGSLGRIAIATSTGLAAGIVVGLSFIGLCWSWPCCSSGIRARTRMRPAGLSELWPRPGSVRRREQGTVAVREERLAGVSIESPLHPLDIASDLRACA